MSATSGNHTVFMTNSPRGKRARTVNFRELAGVKSRRAPGAAAVAAEQALALVQSGEMSSQKAAAAAFGISDGQLSTLKTRRWPAHCKFNTQPTQLVSASGVTYMKEMGVGDESDMSRAEKSARASRNYRRKMAAFRQEVARRQQAASETAVSAVPAGEQPAQQACAFAELGQAELHGAADDGPDEVEGELADGPVEVEGELAELDGAEAALWQRVDALNSHAASGCAAANGAGDASHGALTRNILGQGDGHVERRTRSHAPHEWAALTPAQRRNIREHGTACVCDHCGASRGFDVELGRAHSLQNGSTAMYGANDFVDHEVSLSVLMAEELMEEHGWRGAITIPKCHRCVFEQALVGSAARSEAAALSVWRQKLDLNMAAGRVKANALRLPYVEPAPELDVDTGSGGRERRLGKASVYVMLNKEDVLLGGNDLRRLWYAALTPKLLEGYSPLVVDEALAVDTAAADKVL